MSEQLLIKHTQETLKKHLYEINDHIPFFYSYVYSNATAIIGSSSVILIDTLDSNEYSQDLLNDLRKYTDKPVKTLIYTHGHPDHRGSAGTFRDTVEEIIIYQPPNYCVISSMSSFILLSKSSLISHSHTVITL